MSSSGQVRVVHHDHDPKYNCCCGVHVKTCAALLAVWYSIVLVLGWAGMLASGFRRNEGYGFNFLQTFVIITFVLGVYGERWQFIWPMRIYQFCAIVGLILITLVTCFTVWAMPIDLKGVVHTQEEKRMNSTIYDIEFTNSTTTTMDPTSLKKRDDMLETLSRVLGGFLIVFVIFIAAFVLFFMIFSYRIVTNYQKFAKEKAIFLSNQEVSLAMADKA